jgi:putative membrane-bound dehydrogenase-like protein
MRIISSIITGAIGAFAVFSCQPTSSPLSDEAQQGLGTLEVMEGFRVELFASEPLIADPVAMEIDEQGRLYVVEMHGYPLDTEGSGKIKLLTDTDQDGLPDKSTIYAEGLILPTGIMRWKQGVLVTDAPDVLYFEDTDDDGVADVREVILTGFARSNPQHNLNSPVYGLDNWIYLAHEGTVSTKFFHDQFGGEGEEIRYPSHPDVRLPVNAGGLNVRFRPDIQALEMMSGESQFGHTFDTWGHQILNSNAHHLFHEVLPYRYITRNPNLSLPYAVAYLPSYGPGVEVFPITQNPEHQLLTDVGTITSACGVTWYQGGIFPETFKQVTFVAEPVHNLVHADVIKSKGATFTAERLLPEKEFLASTDSWFRPVNFYVGPNGGLYVIDYYRQIIEHPEWMSEEINRSGALYNGTDQGRIYRIVPEGKSTDSFLNQLSLNQKSDEELVAFLEHDNLWWRKTAQRLLVDRKPEEAVSALRAMATEGRTPPGRVHALWTLEGIDQLTQREIESALQDSEAGVRENAIKLAEMYWDKHPDLQQRILSLQNDPDPKVRFQLLLTLGSLENPKATQVREALLLQDISDEWVQYAALSSTQPASTWLTFAQRNLTENQNESTITFLNKVGNQISQSEEIAEVQKLIQQASGGDSRDSWWHAALLEGLAQGLRESDAISSNLIAEKKLLLKNIRPNCDPDLRQASLMVLTKLGQLPPFESRQATIRAREAVTSTSASPGWQKDALVFLGIENPDQYQNEFVAMLSPTYPSEIQQEALQSLSKTEGTTPCSILLERWASLTPSVRDQAINVFMKGADRTHILLAAVRENQIDPSIVGWRRTVHLMNHDDESIRTTARSIFAGNEISGESAEKYIPYLTKEGNIVNGEAVYQRSCATCHQLKGQVGTAFGPDLSTVKNRSKEAILLDILMPNRSIADGYELWEVALSDGTTQSGIISSETPATITLADLAGNETTIPRNSISHLTALSYSGMPEGLANPLSEEEMNDLLTYLKQI